jgi:hypothetical protein
MSMIFLLFLRPRVSSLKKTLPEPHRWHLLLIPFIPLILMVSINAGLVALIWNRLGLHRLFRTKPLSLKGCVIAGTILLFLGM